MTLIHSVATDGTHIFYNQQTQRYLILTSGGGVEISNSIPIVYKNLTNNKEISIIIGTIRLKFGYYVIIGKSHQITGSILGNDIATIQDFEILPIGINELSKKNNEELQYLKLLNIHLTNATLFYSIDNKYDLTNSLQRQFTTSNLQLDDRFLE